MYRNETETLLRCFLNSSQSNADGIFFSNLKKCILYFNYLSFHLLQILLSHQISSFKYYYWSSMMVPKKNSPFSKFIPECIIKLFVFCQFFNLPSRKHKNKMKAVHKSEWNAFTSVLKREDSFNTT